MTIRLVVARSENKVIGNEGTIPWHVPEDFAHFKELTYGHPIIMGRNTFDSIGRPLPGRTSIVVTRQSDYKKEGVRVVHSVAEAIDLAKTLDDEIFIIGGAQIYDQSFAFADEIVLSEIPGEFVGDTFFEIPAGWVVASREPKVGFTVVRYVRE